MEQLVSRFIKALIALDRVAAAKILEESTNTLDNIQFIESIIVPALDSIGRGWEDGTYALSQVYMSGRITEDLVDSLLPADTDQRVKQPKLAIAVLDDYHMLGKRIVYSMIRASGFEITDYGVKDTDSLVRAVLEDQIEVLMISTLMINAALGIKKVVSTLKKDGARIITIVGGAPFRFDDQLGKEVNADYACSQAAEVLKIIKQIPGGRT